MKKPLKYVPCEKCIYKNICKYEEQFSKGLTMLNTEGLSTKFSVVCLIQKTEVETYGE